MQALYSNELADLDSGFGVRFETTAVHPGFAAAFLPWHGADDHRELMLGLPRAAPLGALLRDRDGGRVRVRRDGSPLVQYRLSDYDARHLRAGIDGAVRILEAAGAGRVATSEDSLYSSTRWAPRAWALRRRPRRATGRVASGMHRTWSSATGRPSRVPPASTR